MCRAERQGLEPFAYESRELLGITAFVANQSRGMPVAVSTGGAAAASFGRGRDLFYTRIGQLDLACSNCHEDRVGSRLRGEPISQGQINGFPVYRQLWQTLGSTHRMFAWCNEAVRAEPFALGSQDYVDLELVRQIASKRPTYRDSGREALNQRAGCLAMDHERVLRRLLATAWDRALRSSETRDRPPAGQPRQLPIRASRA